METIRALIRGDLPPAGNSILISERNSGLPEFVGYEPYWVNSGTAALALALIAARQRQPHIAEPEVIIPGYCCPDLVAAARFAGVSVVVVDITPDDPALDLAAVSAVICDKTVALIAVAFLGIRENLTELLSLVQRHPQVSLIEDNAQWFPEPGELDSLKGDFVIFSFGRGKPLSLLGGGLFLAKSALNPLTLPISEDRAPTAALKLKYLAYNLLLRPQLYQLLNRNPFIKLGETRYHALHSITRLDELRYRLLPDNLNKYWQKTKMAELFYDEIFASSAIENHLAGLTSDRRKRLLRYPVLLPEVTQRDELMKRLSKAGLGSTLMYQKPLAEIEGISSLIKVSSQQLNAADFASRLVTLPLHEGVTETYLMRIAAQLRGIY